MYSNLYINLQLELWHFEAQGATSFSFDNFVDHKLFDNPYWSLYGPSWKDEISKVLRGYICITVIVDHIFAESKRIMADTIHSNDYMVYHDALNQMTSSDCIEYMKQKGGG